MSLYLMIIKEAKQKTKCFILLNAQKYRDAKKVPTKFFQVLVEIMKKASSCSLIKDSILKYNASLCIGPPRFIFPIMPKSSGRMIFLQRYS